MGGSNTGALLIRDSTCTWLGGSRASATHRCCNQCREPQEPHGERTTHKGEAEGRVRLSLGLSVPHRHPFFFSTADDRHCAQVVAHRMIQRCRNWSEGQLSPDGHQWGWDVRSVNWGWISCTSARRPSSRSSPCGGPQYLTKKWC